jgi:hypothetical protein
MTALDEELVRVGETILKLDTNAAIDGHDDLDVYRDMDVVFTDPKTNAKLFVGNVRAASSRETLRRCGVRVIVNAQGLASTNFFPNDEEIEYVRFPIAFWRTELSGKSHDDVVRYFQPLFDAIDQALARGDGVLIHCLAGAHRAATTAAAYLRHRIALKPEDAQLFLRRRRPIVELLPGLFDVLLVLDAALKAVNAAAATTTLEPQKAAL